MTRKWSRFLFTFLVGFSFEFLWTRPEALAAIEYYGTYGLFPQGPNRVTAMGGSFAALSDDASGITYNPAGLGFMPIWGDLAGNANYVGNMEADLDRNGTKDGIPYTFFYYAGALKVGNLAFGAGISSPYVVDLSFDIPNGSYTDNRKLNLSILTVNLPIAYRLSDHWSVGINIQGHTLEERFRFSSTNPSSTPIDVKTQVSGSSVASGVSFRPESHFGFGLYYAPPKQFEVDSSLNSQTGGLQWFKGVKIPAKTTLGGFWKPWSYFTVAMDVDYVDQIQDAVYVGSQLIPEFSRIEVDPKPKVVTHGGFEWNFISTDYWDLYWRMGAYNEPARLVGGSSRNHTTLGFEVRWWVISASLSVDGTENFINAAAGLGLTLKFYM